MPERRTHLQQPTRHDATPADTDPIVIDLTVALTALERARGELLSQSTITQGHAQSVMRLVAIDLETAQARLGAAITRRRAEL